MYTHFGFDIIIKCDGSDIDSTHITEKVYLCENENGSYTQSQ